MSKPNEKPIDTRRAFTIELDSGNDVQRVMVPNGAGGFLLEGTIGKLEHARFIEESVLELTGTRGVIRVDLSAEDLAKPCSNQDQP